MTYRVQPLYDWETERRPQGPHVRVDEESCTVLYRTDHCPLCGGRLGESWPWLDADAHPDERQCLGCGARIKGGLT